ncbi:diguanylate cyclase domain-containing protein [Microcoleus sp. FACHB-672]|uniref:diguanylate cyclase domain-containing protein n=1 Tax=Microcoleus sp. FACHB-672 TaxID=2692825 RepID=UPI00168859EC|nr:diguanylate cyclase [Microcoleus sp. FACHB-672]MBD2040559.1 diguanylate cyclase [Microcoleus sp. FACHB-672]
MLLKLLLSNATKVSTKIPLRIVLVVPFLLQIFAAVGLTGWLSFRNGQKAVNDLTTQLQSAAAARIEERFRPYLETPHIVNQINLDAIEQGLLRPRDLSSIESYFLQQLNLFQAVGYIQWGNEFGEFIGVARVRDDGTLNIEAADASTGNRLSTYTVNSKGHRDKRLRDNGPYDPRKRPWYKAAMQQGKPGWSPVYLGYGTEEVVTDAILPVYDKKGRKLGVLGTTLFLSQIGDFLRSLKISPSAQSFIIERSGLLVASSTLDKPFVMRNGQAERVKATESKDILIRSTAEHLIKHFGNLSEINSSQSLTFELKNQQEFLQITPFRDNRGLDWLIVVVVPEADFMEQIHASNRSSIALGLAALGLATGMGILTARWISKPIHHLSEASKAIAGGELDQNIEFRGVNELRVLAGAFNQMAGQLRESFTALETTNYQLEVRVEQRTASLQQAEAELRALFAGMSELILVVDADGRHLKVAPTNPALLYKPAEELIGKTVYEIFPRSPADTFMAHIQTALDTQETVNFEYSLMIKEREVWFATSISPISHNSVIWVARDITYRVRAEEALRESEERYRSVIAAIAEGIVLVQANGRISACNASAERILGLSTRQIMGRNYTALRWRAIREDGSPFPMEYHPVTIALRTSVPQSNAIMGLHKPDGRLIWISINCQPLLQAGETLPHAVVASFSDITARQRAEAALQKANRELERLATLDGLTQVANRRRFDQYLSQEWVRLGREMKPLSLILCDVDYFKNYNDTYGHQAGDDCLQQVARALNRTLQSSAHLLARYGGEEFAIILPNTNAETAFTLAEALRLAVQQLKIEHAKSSVSQYVSLSLGVAAIIPTQEFSPKTLISVADKALYLAKNQGRNRIASATFSPVNLLESCHESGDLGLSGSSRKNLPDST